jgi:hypothetical protein
MHPRPDSAVKAAAKVGCPDENPLKKQQLVLRGCIHSIVDFSPLQSTALPAAVSGIPFHPPLFHALFCPLQRRKSSPLRLTPDGV